MERVSKKVLPGIYKSPDGRWVDVYCMGYDTENDGKRVVVYNYVGDKTQYVTDSKWFEPAPKSAKNAERFVEATTQEIDALVKAGTIKKSDLFYIAARRETKSYRGREGASAGGMQPQA